METIIKYLHDPMKVGVVNAKYIVDFSGVLDYLKELIKEYKESYAKLERKEKPPKHVFENRLSRFSEALEALDEEFWDEEGIFESLIKTFREFAIMDEFPEDLGKFFYREREHKLPSGRIVSRKVRRPYRRIPAIFHSRIHPEVKDVFSIEKKHVANKKWLFDVLTIKEPSLATFKNFFQCIPAIKKRMKTLKERKQFSARYTFRPYPLVAELWLQDDTSIIVPPDLKSFLHGAIRYIHSAEWRTSIVLSSITVESELADLYEEKFKKPAPDTPLGDLFRQVREKIDFPPEIVDSIKITNRARIAAVHRSRLPVSDREAINALYGATNFTMWYSSHF